MTKGRFHMRQDPVHLKLQARGQGSVQATESLEAAHARRMSGGAPTNHLHGEKDRCRSRKDMKYLCAKDKRPERKHVNTTSVRKAGSR